MNMETFTLSEIIIANRLMFPADFERLWKKHSATESDSAGYFARQYKYHKSNILSFLNEYPYDDEVVDTVSKMLRDILS